MTCEVPLIYDDPREIESIWYPGEDAGGYSTITKFDSSTSAIRVYREPGELAFVPFYAVYDADGAIKARVPAGHVTVVYKKLSE